VLIIELSSEKHALQNIQNDCYEAEGLSGSCRVHQIRFWPGGGAHDAPPEPLVGWGGDTPSPFPTPSTRSASRSRRLGDSFSAPSAPRSQNPLRNFFLDTALDVDAGISTTLFYLYRTDHSSVAVSITLGSSSSSSSGDRLSTPFRNN